MFTLGHGEFAGEAEFAAVETPRFWNQGFLTEMALSLFFLRRDLKIDGEPVTITNRIGGQEVTSPLITIAGTARRDNPSHVVLRALRFTPRVETTGRYGDGVQTRDMFREKVDVLDQLRKDSEYVQDAVHGSDIMRGRFSDLEPVPNKAPSAPNPG